MTAVTLDRPERRNALDGRSIGLLSRIYADLDADDAVRSVPLYRGQFGVHCARADLNSARRVAFPYPA